MFFDNETLRNGKKRLYVMGTKYAREDAMIECIDAVDFKEKKGKHANGGGRRGGRGGGVAVVCRPDSSAGTSSQHSHLKGPCY